MREWIAFLVLAAFAGALAATVPPALAVSVDGSLTTFADGSPSATLHFNAGCSANGSLSFLLPERANVSNATLRVVVTNDANRTGGSLVFDIGADRNPDGALTVTGNNGTGTNGSNVTLSAEGFNASIGSQNASGGAVRVPLQIDSCSLPAGWTVRLDHVNITYSVGSPSSAHTPEFRGSIPDVRLPANSTFDTGVYVPSFFFDADGDPLLFDVVQEESASAPPPGVTLVIDSVTGNLTATANGSWTGALRFHLTARDPANQTTSSNDATVTVLAPDQPPVFAGRIADLTATAGVATPELLDMSPFFSDPNGLPLDYSVVDRDGSALWPSVDLAVRGSLLDLNAAGDSNAVGLLCFALRATDANGSTADSNRLCLKLVPPVPFATVSFTVDPASPPPQNLKLHSEAPLPPDAHVTWFVDGELAGEGEALSISMEPGAHTVRMVVQSGGQTIVSSRTVDVPAAPALSPPSSGGRITPGVAYAILASIALLAFAISRVEVVRYFATGALLAGLFSRLKGESLLTHFTRGRLYQTISEHPGIRFNELKRLTGIPNGSAVHHLRVLVKGEYIRAVADGTATRFYTTGATLDEEEYGLLDADEEIIIAVQQNPGLSIGALSKRIERSPSSTSRAVSRLADLGYLRRERNGRKAAIFPRLKPGASAGGGAGPFTNGGS